MLNYRPEIDGLRALAVTSVILYHAQFTFFEHILFQGGFIGVDIFFIISGYLISKIILLELMDRNKFNFLSFYSRRSRRILPVLIFVICVSLIYGYLVLNPKELLELSKSALASLIFVSNIFLFFYD